MTKEEVDLILHPLRYRLLQTLQGKQLTTQQIAEEMHGYPVSSIYRHLKTLLDAGLVQIVETRKVKGVDEKVYTSGERLTVTEDEFSQYSRDDHQRYFASFLSYLLRRFSDYVSEDIDLDMLADQTGFTEMMFYATQADLDQLGATLNQELIRLSAQEKTPQRQRQLFSVITFPVERKEK